MSSTGDHAVGDDLLSRVDVVEQCLERAHALGDARCEPVPLLAVEDPGDGVQGERALDAPDVERDTLGQVGASQRVRSRAQLVGRELPHRRVHVPIGLTDVVVGLDHLVPRDPRRVAVEDVFGHGSDRNPEV